jgi:crossover junction endodeoxyribonuclease RusA
MKCELTLPLAISANRYWRTRVIKPKAGPAIVSTYVSAEAKAFKEKVAWVASRAGLPPPVDGRFMLHITLHPHRPLDWKTRQRKDPEAWETTVQAIDLDNSIKVCLDSLAGIAFVNDKDAWALMAERGEPVPEGKVVVRWWPYVPEAGTTVREQVQEQLEIAA